MVQFELEKAMAGELPDGFDTTLIESDRLRQLNNTNPGSTLTGTVEDYDDHTLTERDVVRVEVQRIINSFQTADAEGGTLELPGTTLEFSNLQRFASYYKNDNDTPSGTVKDLRRANTDDIVFTFATPEVYEEITGTAQDTFEVNGVSGGSTVELVGDTGLNETGPTNGASMALDDDEMMYFTGDYIDLSGGQSALSKIQWSDVDGEDYGHDSGVLSTRLSGTHIFTAQGAWIKSTADLDAKAYVDGNAEIVPVAFYMGPGNKAPNLV